MPSRNSKKPVTGRSASHRQNGTHTDTFGTRDPGPADLEEDGGTYPDPSRLAANPYPVLDFDRNDGPYPSTTLLQPPLRSGGTDGTPDSDSDDDEDVGDTEYETDALPILAPELLADVAGSSSGRPDLGLSNNPDESDMDDLAALEAVIDEALDAQTSGTAPSASHTVGQARARRRGWRQFLKGTGFENLGKGERGPAPPRRKSKKNRAGRAHVDPGRDFRENLARASQEFLAQHYDEAADFARAAVEANPEVFAAHSLLSEILKKQGRDEDALQVLMWGAHVSRTPTVWLNILERLLEQLEVLQQQAPTTGEVDRLLREAMDCAKEALKLKTALTDGMEYTLRRHKFQLHVQLQEVTEARKAGKAILKRWPGDIQMCQEYAELCAATKDMIELRHAKTYYDAALGLKENQTTIDDLENPWRHVLAYLEVVTSVDPPADAIAAGKRLSRWLLGRKEETFWDNHRDDDREFDVEEDRRKDVDEYQWGLASHDPTKYGEGLPIEVRVKLGLLRLRLGSSQYAEAQKHFKHLLDYEDNIEYYYDLFLSVARNLDSAQLHTDATAFYNVLRDVPDVIDEPTWMAMGLCYETTDCPEDAVECFEEVLQFRGANYGLASARLAKWCEDSGDLERARTLVDEVIALGQRNLLADARVQMIPAMSAREKVMAAANAERRNGAMHMNGSILRDVENVQPPGPVGEGTFGEFRLERHATPPETDMEDPEPAPKRKAKKRARQPREKAPPKEKVVKRPRLQKPPSKRVTAGEERLRRLQDAGSRVRANWIVVEMHWPALKQRDDPVAVDQWTESALNLLDDFNSMKVFFPDRDKNMQVKAGNNEEQPFVKIGPRQHNPSAPKEFHGTPFTTWHHAFADLALLFASSAEQTRCYKILQETLLVANVFWQNPRLELTGYAVALCCALMFNDGQFVVDLSRKLIAITTDPTRSRTSSFSTAAYQLFAAVNRFPYGSNWFHAGPSQKFMLRMVKGADFLAMPADMRSKYDFAMNTAALAQRLAKWEERKEKERAYQERKRQSKQPQPSTASDPESDAEDDDADDADPLSDRTFAFNPYATATYGNQVAVANHSFSALPYYFRTLALCPTDPALNLSIATMWIQNSMKRQTTNRHFGLAQGLGFLYRYYALRTANRSAAARQEAEFNLARMWQGLGLAQLAMRGYERVLAMSDALRREAGPEAFGLEGEFVREDFAAEAAFALQGLYAAVGNEEAAARVTAEWLVL